MHACRAAQIYIGIPMVELLSNFANGSACAPPPTAPVYVNAACVPPTSISVTVCAAGLACSTATQALQDCNVLVYGVLV